MSTTRPDLVNLPQLTNPTDPQTKFVVQDSGVNQTLTADQTRQFLGNMIGPTGPQGPQGVQGPEGPQGVQGPQGPTFFAYSTSTATPQNTGSVLLVVSTSNHSFVSGNRVIAISEPNNFFEGTLYVTGGTNFNIVADYNKGTISSSSWSVTLAGQLGSTGPTGPQGVQGPQGPSFKVTSNSSATPASSGNITLTVSTSNHAFIAGQRVIAVNASNNYFEGTLNSTGIDNQTFLISADYNFGSITTSSWTIGLSGQRGPAGPQGPQGIQGPTGPMVYAKKTGGVSVTPDGTSLTTLVIDPQYSNHLFVKGLRVAVMNTDGNFFEGTITNNVVNTTTFIIKQDSYVGGTAATDWNIVLAGKLGPQGPQGPASSLANEATNVTGGTTGSILIQSAVSATSFINPGSNGNLLQYQSNTASWVSTTTVNVGYANNANQVFARSISAEGNKYVGIISNAGVFAGVGVQTGFEYDTTDETLSVSNVVITSNSGTVSSSTGALQVEGGVGIGQDLYVAGTIFGVVTTASFAYTANTASNAYQADLATTATFAYLATTATYAQNLLGSINLASNISGGAAGQLVVQTGTNLTGFVPVGANDYVLVARGSSTPTWQNTLSLSSTATSINAATGALTVAGGVGIGSNLNVGGLTRVLDSTNATSTTTGAVVITGGVGIGKDLYAGAIYDNGSRVITLASLGSYGVSSITAGTDTAVSTSTGAVLIWNTSTLQSITDRNSATSNAISITNQTAASSTITGALKVAGGVGIGQDLYIGGSQVINSTNANTGSATANALYVKGGAFIEKSLVVKENALFEGNVVFSGTATYVYSTNTVLTDNLLNLHVPPGSTGTDHTWTLDDGKDIGFLIHYYKGADKDAFLGLANDTGYLEWYDNGTESGGIFTGTSYGTIKAGGLRLAGGVQNGGNTNTGDLQVLGGAGIGGNLYVGGTIYGFASVVGTITTASNIAGGTAGQLVYQSAANVTSFAGPGTAGQLLVSQGTSAPTYTTTSSIYVGRSDLAYNLAAGATGSIPYQNAINSTTFLPIGANGSVLMSNGTTITWTATSGLISGQTVVQQTTTNATHFITFVDSNNAAGVSEVLYTTSSMVVNPSTGNYGLGVTPTTKLDVNGGVKISGVTTITNTTSATSTITGALQVAGGVGIAGSMYLNGYLQVGYSTSSTYSTGTNGEIRATNEITAYYSSDKNLKENIRLIENPITLITQINGYYFDWKDDYISTRGGEDGFFVRKSDVGVIAQEIENILPQIVATRDNGTKAVKYEKLVPLLIEAIKVLNEEIESLKKKIL